MLVYVCVIYIGSRSFLAVRVPVFLAGPVGASPSKLWYRVVARRGLGIPGDSTLGAWPRTVSVDRWLERVGQGWCSVRGLPRPPSHSRAAMSRVRGWDVHAVMRGAEQSKVVVKDAGVHACVPSSCFPRDAD